MKKKDIILFYLLFINIQIFAHVDHPTFKKSGTNDRHQDYSKKFTERLFFGGGFGFQFGSLTMIDVSPIVGYKITDRLSAGLGVKYQYQSWKDINFKTNVYGGSIFTRYIIWENLFAHVEYEYLNFEAAIFDINYNILYTERINVHSFFVGGGYRQPIGANSYLYLLVLWNLNETPQSPYQNPIIRMGVSFGL